MATIITCGHCNGIGQIGDPLITCPQCNGKGIYDADWVGVVRQSKSLLDAQTIEIADIKDKVNDIKEKVDEIKAKVDTL